MIELSRRQWSSIELEEIMQFGTASQCRDSRSEPYRLRSLEHIRAAWHCGPMPNKALQRTGFAGR